MQQPLQQYKQRSVSLLKSALTIKPYVFAF